MSRTSGSAFRGALVGSTLTALLFIAVLEISEQPDLPAVLLWRGQEIVVDATAAGAAGDADAVYADPVNDDEAGRSPRAKKGKTLKAPSAKTKAKKKAARGSGAAKRPTSDAETGALLMVDADLITRRTFYDAVWETAAKLPPLTAAAAADAQIAAGGHELVFIGGQHFSGTSLVEVRPGGSSAAARVASSLSGSLSSLYVQTKRPIIKRSAVERGMVRRGARRCSRRSPMRPGCGRTCSRQRTSTRCIYLSRDDETRTDFGSEQLRVTVSAKDLLKASQSLSRDDMAHKDFVSSEQRRGTVTRLFIKAESSCMRVAVGGVCSAPENEGVFLTKARGVRAVV